MPGTSQGVLITSRDRQLLEALCLLRVVDRQQAAEVFGRATVSVSTTNIRLAKLYRAKLLSRFYLGTPAGGRKALYALTHNAGLLLGQKISPLQRPKDALLVGDLFVAHQLAINTVLIAARYRPPQNAEFVRWLTFSQALCQDIPLIPDGYVELKSPTGTLATFCEVDRGTEAQKIWQKKTQSYLQLAVSGQFEALFRQQRFRVLVVADSHRRLLSIRKTAAQQTSKIFWFATLEAINREGLFGSIWLRPEGEERHSLI